MIGWLNARAILRKYSVEEIDVLIRFISHEQNDPKSSKLGMKNDPKSSKLGMKNEIVNVM